VAKIGQHMCCVIWHFNPPPCDTACVFLGVSKLNLDKLHMVHILFINHMNTTLTPTNAQQHFDVVLLQGILQHVLATYMAIFRTI